MTRIEELRKKLDTLDSNSNMINRFEDVICRLNTSVKLEFWLDGEPCTCLNISARLSKEGFKAVKDAIVSDFRSQIVSMIAQNKEFRKELGEHEDTACL